MWSKSYSFYVIFLHLAVNKSILSEQFKGMHLYYNQETFVNEPVTILITAESLSDEEATVELSTPNYAIVSFLSSDESKLESTSDLRQLCEMFEIVDPPNKPPNQAMYYYARQAIFVHLGPTVMTLSVSDALTSEEIFKGSFSITVKLPPYQCFPTIRLNDCTSPHSPMKVSIFRRNIFDAIVERSCGRNSKIRIIWAIRDFLDEKTLHKFYDIHTPTLRVPPYTLWFKNPNPLFPEMHIVKIKVEEKHPDGSDAGFAMARCYIMVVMGPPTAIIRYGNYRKIHVNKKVVLDGSRSHDATGSMEGANLLFRWHCSTDDMENSFCRDDMGSTNSIVVPRNKLKIGRTYNFSLEVTAIRTALVSTTWQEVVPTHQDQLLVSYKCLRNCIGLVASPQGIIHLIGICETCFSQVAHFQWTINSATGKLTKTGLRLIIKTSEFPVNTNVLTVELVVKAGSQQGYLRFSINIENFSKIGSCSVSPEQGVEYETEFSISCQGFASDFEPLTYTLYQGDQLIESQTSSVFKVKLSKSDKSNAADLKIVVADAIHNYAETHIKIHLKPFEIPTSAEGIINFLESPTSDQSFQDRLTSGDITSAALMVRIAADKINQLDNAEAKSNLTELVLELLSHGNLPTAESIDKISTTVYTLLKDSIPVHSLAEKTARVFNMITSALEHTSHAGDMWDFNPVRCMKMNQAFMEVSVKFFEPVEPFPEVENDDLLSPGDYDDENYPDYGHLDFSVIYRIMNWKIFADSSRELFQTLGRISFEINEPQEADLHFEIGKASWQMTIVGVENHGNIQHRNEDDMVDMPASLLDELKKTYDESSKVGFQTIFTIDNPFWWCPEQYRANTHVAMVNVFSQKSEYSQHIVHTVNEKFDLFLARKDGLNRHQSFEVNGYVEPQDDMPIYQSHVPDGSFLTADILSTSADIRVLMKIDNFPKYREILKTYVVVSKNTLPVRIRQKNFNHASALGYIAIHPLHANSTENIRFRFQTAVSSCNIWDIEKARWSGDFCEAGPMSNDTHIHCRCNHFSHYVGKMFKSPNYIKLPRDVIKSLEANIMFLLAFILFLAILTGLLIWAKYKDTTDQALYEVYFEGKADPDRNYMYLVSITTGSHRHAGTTANITIQLIGSRRNSKDYVISCRLFYHALRKKSENTIAIMTHKYLGPLTSIVISNDYTGRYPSWYCSSIRVKDTVRREEYVFIVDRWFSKIYGTETKAEIYLATEADLKNVRAIVTGHFKRCFKEMYLWYGLFYPHPRSPLTRMEKTIIFVTGFCFGAMLSVMFFGRTTLENVEEERVKYKRFVLFFTTIFHTILCTIAGMLLSMLLVLLFIKSKTPSAPYKIIYGKEK